MGAGEFERDHTVPNELVVEKTRTSSSTWYPWLASPCSSPSTSRSRIPFTCDAGSAKWDEHEFAGCHKRRDAGARAWRKDSPRERRRPPVVLGRVRGRTRLNYIVVGPNERASAWTTRTDNNDNKHASAFQVPPAKNNNNNAREPVGSSVL